MSRASLPLSPLSVTEKPEFFAGLFLIPIHRGPYTMGSRCIKPEALRSFPVTNTHFSVPKLPHFLSHTSISGLELPWNVHPHCARNNDCSEGKSVPRASGQEILAFKPVGSQVGLWGAVAAPEARNLHVVSHFRGQAAMQIYSFA